jgi:glycogen debranching enzyme
VNPVTEPGSLAREGRSPLEWASEDLEVGDRRRSLEWLEADGLGGFACGTAGGPSVRRYHGWYSPPAPPAARRRPLVAGCEEFVWCDGEAALLSDEIRAVTGGASGGRGLVRFALEPFPTWRHELDRFSIERSLCLVRGRSIAIARYANRGARSIGLRARPLLRAGEPQNTARNGAREVPVEIHGEAAWIGPVNDAPRLFLRGPGARALAETRSGPDEGGGNGTDEELWGPVAWDWVLPPGEEAYLLFSTEDVSTDPAHLLEAERSRRRAAAPSENPLFDELARRAEVFLVDGDSRDGSIVAGYPDHPGRDSMIPVQGLTLATGRYAGVARAVNSAAARLRASLLSGLDSGRAPAGFASSDAPLWFVLAVEWFTRARRDPSRPTPLLSAVRSVLAAYRQGEWPGIAVGPDGLVSGHFPGRALTWMNAVVDAAPVTPRYGRAVEVNVLWHAALKAAARLERLAEEGARARELETEAWHVGKRFNDVFWSPEKEYLYDVVGPDGSDASLRPNQIFAVSLRDDLLPPHRARAVYWAVRGRLLTPFGLRTLDPRDPRYRGHCGGSARERALALHQGAAWPWLMGAFADAHFRVLGQTPETRRSMQVWLEALKAHVAEAGVGSISEVFDGDEPQAPRGCFAEARSVAEISRIFLTYLKD